MTIEILSAKILAPFFGNSLYVWTAVLGTTLLGLASGYFLGGKYSTKTNLKKYILVCSLLPAFLIFILPFSSQIILKQTLGLGLEVGTITASFLLLFPIIMCFGMISPLIISEISKDSNLAGKNASLIYTISTVGGILFALLTGLYFITTLGIKNTCYLTTILLLFAILIYTLSNKNSISKELI